jgi:alpha-1,3-rhamnosyl/mannosyltransferase
VTRRTTRPYLFDARSSTWGRTSGWERYTREIGRRLAVSDPDVLVRDAGSPRIASRLWQDAVGLPVAARGTRVVHFPTFPPVPWVANDGAVVYTLHDLTWWRWSGTASRMGRHYYSRLASRALHGTVHVVTVSTTVRDEVVEAFGIDESRVTVAPLGVELPEPTPERLVPRPYFLAVGTVEPRKNFSTLAAAFQAAGLSATHDLVVVGRLGWGQVPDGVRLMHGLDDRQLAAMYRDAAVVVVPSVYEGFGLPAVEAMQAGAPVLCADIPVLREVTGGHGRYVAPDDVDAMADQLLDIVGVSTDAGAATWARETYRWDRTVATLSALYRQLDADRRFPVA